MSEYITLKRADTTGKLHEFQLEDLGEAVVYQGHVALREINEISINDAPGQCWGAYIHAEAGDCLVDEKQTLEQDTCWCIDEAGASVELITLDSLDPFKVSFVQHIGVPPLRCGEKPEKHSYKYIAQLEWHYASDEANTIEITGAHGNLAMILIPGYINGCRVKTASLIHCSLADCRTLIVDPGVEELSIGFENAHKLSRIEISDSTSLALTPSGLDATPWFRNQPKGEVYLARWYCGCNGDGHYRDSKLRLREGTVGVAGHADFESCWKSIIMPDSVVDIGPWAFSRMPALEHLRLSEGLINMEKYVFFDCPRLAELHLPDSLIGMGDAVFGLAIGLKNLSLPRHLFSGDYYFFSWTPYLTLRDEEGTELVSRVRESHPVNGNVTVYKRGQRFKINGKSYRSFAQLCREPLGLPEGTDFLDIYGNFVRHVAEYDYSRKENGDYGYYQGEAWYVVTEKGLCMVCKVLSNDDNLVHEYLQPEDISPRHCYNVMEHFDKVKKNED